MECDGNIMPINILQVWQNAIKLLKLQHCWQHHKCLRNTLIIICIIK